MGSPYFTTLKTVSPSIIEPVYNHVHHATALRFLEEARLEYLVSIGCSNDSLIARNLFLVITDITIKYLREIFAGEIVVTCENPIIDGKTVILDQRILNSRGKPMVTAKVSSMFLSGETKRSVPPPEDFLNRFLLVSH